MQGHKGGHGVKGTVEKGLVDGGNKWA